MENRCIQLSLSLNKIHESNINTIGALNPKDNEAIEQIIATRGTHRATVGSLRDVMKTVSQKNRFVGILRGNHLCVHSSLVRLPLYLIASAILMFWMHTSAAFAQQTDSTEAVKAFSGAVSITNDGIAAVPALSLGEPAVILSFSMGDRFRFQPEFKSSLEGIPWSFNFWWRYDVVRAGRFRASAGMPLFVSFRSLPAIINEVSGEAIVARRFLGVELNPSYRATSGLSFGSYYLFSHSFDPNVPDNSHYISLYSVVSNIALFNQIALSIRPQLYYLWIDRNDGFYVASSATITHKKSPFSISAVVNRKISARIPASPDFLWNVTLIFSY